MGNKRTLSASLRTEDFEVAEHEDSSEAIESRQSFMERIVRPYQLGQSGVQQQYSIFRKQLLKVMVGRTSTNA